MLNVILNLVVIAKGVFCLDLNFDAQTCIDMWIHPKKKDPRTGSVLPNLCASIVLPHKKIICLNHQ